MPNTFFQFRQFTIHQEQTAMKVCTDACLFGAWVANFLENYPTGYILDIGAGTGLLSLMMAQATTAQIDAVEADENAFSQASDNFLHSPWASQLHIFHQQIQDFVSPHQYDFVISNPPFYEYDLKSPDEHRNVAMHSKQMDFYELLTSVLRLVKPEGKAAFLIPFQRQSNFEALLSAKGFVAERKTFVSQTEKHSPFRVMYIVGMQNQATVSDHIIIKCNNSYTDDFNALMKSYYL